MTHHLQDTIKKTLYKLALASTLPYFTAALPMSPENNNMMYQRPHYPSLAGIDQIPDPLPPLPVIPGIPDLLNTPHNQSREQNRTIVLDEQTCIALIRALVRYEMQQQVHLNELNHQRNILFQFRDYPVLGLISLAYEQYPQLTVTLLALATGTALWHYDKIIELYQKTKEKVIKALSSKKHKPRKK